MVSITAALENITEEFTEPGLVLPGLPGDRRLLSEYPRFRRIRRAAFLNNLRFVRSGPLFEAYLASPLTALDEMTRLRMVPYRTGFSDDDLARLCGNPALGGVSVFHETMHLLIRTSREYLRALEKRTGVSLAFLLLIEESIVNGAEWIMALDIESASSRLAWALQSPVTTTPDQRHAFARLRDRIGESEFFHITCASYLCANLLRDERIDRDFEELMRNSTATAAAESESLRTFFAQAFRLDRKFRNETNSTYLSFRLGRPCAPGESFQPGPWPPDAADFRELVESSARLIAR